MTEKLFRKVWIGKEGDFHDSVEFDRESNWKYVPVENKQNVEDTVKNAMNLLLEKGYIVPEKEQESEEEDTEDSIPFGITFLYDIKSSEGYCRKGTIRNMEKIISVIRLLGIDDNVEPQKLEEMKVPPQLLKEEWFTIGKQPKHKVVFDFTYHIHDTTPRGDDGPCIRRGVIEDKEGLIKFLKEYGLYE